VLAAPVCARWIAAEGTAQQVRPCPKLLLLSEIAGTVSMQSADSHAISPLSASLLDGAFW